jgi:3D (Asp-Asp-Asp) domain-containing protein
MTGSPQDRKSACFVLMALFIFLIIVTFLQTAILRNINRAKYIHSDALTGIRMEGFTMTAYCPGPCCNGMWAGLTASGKPIQYYTERGMNVAAVDPTVIALGSFFEYRDKIYFAADIGGRIKGRRIDIFKPDHAQAEIFGVKKGQSIRLLGPREKISQLVNISLPEVL